MYTYVYIPKVSKYPVYYIKIFSFYLPLSETNPKLTHKFSHRMEVRDPTSFSQKYDIDLILSLKK